MKNLTSVKLQIADLNERIDILHERSYQPDLSASEAREINKRKKKLREVADKELGFIVIFFLSLE